MNDAASYLEPLFKLRSQLRCWVRVICRDGASTVEGRWGQLLIMPVAGYLEASAGPVPLRNVEWIELSTISLKGGMAGRPLQMVDVKDEILAGLRGTQFEWVLCDSTWSLEHFFKDEPVQVIRIVNPFGPTPRP